MANFGDHVAAQRLSLAKIVIFGLSPSWTLTFDSKHFGLAYGEYFERAPDRYCRLLVQKSAADGSQSFGSLLRILGGGLREVGVRGRSTLPA